MQFHDAKLPSDTIEAMIRRETHGDLVVIEIQAKSAEYIYLTREDAEALGRYLIALAAQIKRKAK